jgi:hypothetical protein
VPDRSLTRYWLVIKTPTNPKAAKHGSDSSWSQDGAITETTRGLIKRFGYLVKRAKTPGRAGARHWYLVELRHYI